MTELPPDDDVVARKQNCSHALATGDRNLALLLGVLIEVAKRRGVAEPGSLPRRSGKPCWEVLVPGRT